MLLKLKALASAERLAIVSFVEDGRGRNVTDVAKHINLSQSATSQHLAKLRDAEIVKAHPFKNEVRYALHPMFNWSAIKAALS